MIIGPIAQYHENSKYYSAVRPQPNPAVDRRLPHITIEMPVYKESLEETMCVFGRFQYLLLCSLAPACKACPSCLQRSSFLVHCVFTWSRTLCVRAIQSDAFYVSFLLITLVRCRLLDPSIYQSAQTLIYEVGAHGSMPRRQLGILLAATAPPSAVISRHAHH